MKSLICRSMVLLVFAMTASAGLPVPGPPSSTTPDWIATAIALAGLIGIVIIFTNRYVRER